MNDSLTRLQQLYNGSGGNLGSYQEALQALGADGQARGPSSMLPIQEAWQVLRGDGQAEGASPMSPKQALGVLHQAETQAKAQARRNQSPYQGDWQALGAEGPSFVSPAQEAQAQAQAQAQGNNGVGEALGSYMDGLTSGITSGPEAQAQAQVPSHVPSHVPIIPQEQLLGLLALGAGDNKGIPQGDPYAASGVGDQQALLQRALQNLTGQAS